MHQAMITLSGIYNADPTLFDSMQLPEGISKDDMIGNLLTSCYGLEVLYPDPVTFKGAIGYWSRKRIGNWNRMKKALDIEYDPLYNFDRNEEWSESEKSAGKDSGKVDNLRTSYDSEDLRQTDQANSSGSSEASLERTHKARLYGNIGVTTSQQMLEAEIEVSHINLMDIIASEFRKEFCLLVY